MEIRVNNEENRCVVTVIGRLDTNTAIELDVALQSVGAPEVLLSCSELEYVSSAGLRVILAAHKRLTAEGQTLRLTGLRAEVRSVFEMTGFVRILNIE